MTRRGFMAGLAGTIAFRDTAWAALQKLQPSNAAADDEAFWTEVRKQFIFHDKLTSFNHVGLAPPSKQVMEEMTRQYQRAASIPTQIIWREQIREIEAVRDRLAKFIGAKSTETALTYNATFGLQTGIMGWPLQKGEAIITTSHDYSRTFTAIRQRARRDGVELIEIPVKTPPASKEEVLESWRKALKPNVKLAVLCTVTFLNGHILPVKDIVDLCHANGVEVLIDGAQSIGLLPTEFAKWNGGMYTACLHKWLMAPVATGVFAVKEDLIPKVWSLSPSEDTIETSIKKYEQVGTRPFAPILAIHQALDFHEWIGMDAKFRRIEYLRKKLMDSVILNPNMTLYNNPDSTSNCAIVAVGFRKIGAVEAVSSLASLYKIHVTTALRGGLDAARISPNIFTSMAEIEHLIGALKKIAE